MTQETARNLRRRLTQAGLASTAIRAAWPRWWSDEAERSVSARVDLRFALARNLGLDPRTLLDAQQSPVFLWNDQVRFKRLTAPTDVQRDSIASFGHALATLLVAATRPGASVINTSASGLRKLVIDGGAPFVRLVDVLSLCWSIGIPVIHMRVFPGRHKRMAAMTVRLDDRYAVLLAKDSVYPASTAFYLAHELGHIWLTHLESHSVIVDQDPETAASGGDAEEATADAFALELLTGDPQPTVLPHQEKYTARSLASSALSSSELLHIEPGVLTMCFGYSTNRWRTVNAAQRYVYTVGKPVWREINELARSELVLEALPADGRVYVETVLGLAT